MHTWCLYIMKHGIAIIILFIYSGVLKAHSFIGGSISYQHLGGTKYQIEALILSNCIGIQPPQTEVVKATDGNSSISFYVNKVSVLEKTIQDSNSCAFSNPFGVRENKYLGTIDIDTLGSGVFKTSCIITFYIEDCCRNASITSHPSGNAIIIAKLFKCVAPHNTGPKFLNINFSACVLNQPNFINPVVFDSIEMDILFFEPIAPKYSLHASENFYGN